MMMMMTISLCWQGEGNVATVHVDPFAECKLSVLSYVRGVHDEIAAQLDSLEQQITGKCLQYTNDNNNVLICPLLSHTGEIHNVAAREAPELLFHQLKLWHLP
jgi:hypothetical protein